MKILLWFFLKFKWNLYSFYINRSRGVASGLTAGLFYFMAFLSKKTYYNLETTMSLPGVTLFYAILSAFALILMYLILPETEDRTLEEIELHFSDKTKKITDIKIIKSANNTNSKDVENWIQF